MAQSGTDFHLPDEILSVIPTDPYDQLDLARKITSMAIASRVNKLESEAGRLRQRIAERDRTITDLEEKVDLLDRLIHESDAQLRTALEENAKLLKERDMLALTSKKLGRDLAKLENFKRHLMQSLSDDSTSQQTENVDIGTYNHSVARMSSWKDENSYSRTIMSDLISGSTDAEASTQDASRPPGYQLSLTPYITPRLTPTSTPKISSTGGSPRGFSTTGSSPRLLSGSTSPKSRFQGTDKLPSWYPSSQQSSAPGSPSQRRSFQGRPHIDGKEFFRQARSRLSYEQFSAFLANIKELNSNRQSREETLEKAEQIFGTDNKDLYILFQGLLNRNLP